MKENRTGQKVDHQSQAVTVLVVDDHQGMLQSLGSILDDEGYKVSLAGSGLAAIEICQKQTFDIILMDVRMPGIDGLETLRRIKDSVHSTRIIMMSAYSVEELKQRAIQEGAMAFLQKPVDIDLVIKLVNRVEQPSILLAIENELERDTLENYLSQHNYQAHATSEPAEVFKLSKQICFSIIILDTRVGDGLEMYQTLKDITPTALFILLDKSETGVTSVSTEIVSEGDTGLNRSLDIDQLLSILEKY